MSANRKNCKLMIANCKLQIADERIAQLLKSRSMGKTTALAALVFAAVKAKAAQRRAHSKALAAQASSADGANGSFDPTLDGRFRPRGLVYGELRRLAGRGGAQSRCNGLQWICSGKIRSGLDLQKAGGAA
jgi:hypothetical protein